MKPLPEKIIVKRDTAKILTFLKDDDIIRIDDEEENDERNVDTPLARSRRSIRMLHGSIGQNQLSPLSVTYAANYDEKENKGWVKPLFSSIVYRLPVSLI